MSFSLPVYRAYSEQSLTDELGIATCGRSAILRIEFDKASNKISKAKVKKILSAVKDLPVDIKEQVFSNYTEDESLIAFDALLLFTGDIAVVKFMPERSEGRIEELYKKGWRLPYLYYPFAKYARVPIDIGEYVVGIAHIDKETLKVNKVNNIETPCNRGLYPYVKPEILEETDSELIIRCCLGPRGAELEKAIR